MLMGMMIIVGFIVGFLVGCTGMGGIILIPALVYLSGLSSHVAMGTTLFTFIFTASLCSWLYICLLYTSARDAGIFIPCAGDVAAAVDDVDDAGGQADFHEDLAHELHEIGRLGGRLVDKGVARADGEGDEPAEYQRGEVEGRDAAEYAEGLFRDLAGDAPGDLLEGLALNQRGDGAGHFDDFDDALDLSLIHILRRSARLDERETTGAVGEPSS